MSPPYVAPSPLLATQSLVSINVQTVGHDRSESLIMTDSHRKYHHIYLYIYTYVGICVMCRQLYIDASKHSNVHIYMCVSVYIHTHIYIYHLSHARVYILDLYEDWFCIHTRWI